MTRPTAPLQGSAAAWRAAVEDLPAVLRAEPTPPASSPLVRWWHAQVASRLTAAQQTPGEPR